MSTTVTQPLFISPGAKSESGEDAGGKRYADTARPEDDGRRRIAASRLFAQPDRSPSGRGSLTLDQRMSGVWEGLLRTGTADCPVCRGPMERAGDSGHCLRCESILS
jgi:hypothetical protein